MNHLRNLNISNSVDHNENCDSAKVEIKFEDRVSVSVEVDDSVIKDYHHG